MNGLNLKLIFEAVDRLTAPVRNMTGKLASMFKSATAGARVLAEQLDKAGKKAAEVGGFLTGRVTLPIVGIGALAIRSAGQVEDLVMQMEHLAGGAEQAQEFVKSIQEYINKFGAEEVSKAARLLETAGYNMDGIRDRLKFLGDVAAGSRTELSALTDQYIELRKAGKVSDGDLGAMMKANIPIVAELGKQLGKSDKQIINMAANGKITFEHYRNAMQGLTKEGGRFYGAMERQGKSIFGVFKEMGNTLRSSLADLGFDLWEDLEIADKIKAITSAVRGLIEGFMGLPKWLKSSITWFVLILAAIGPVLLIVGQLTVGIAGMLFAFGKLPLLLAGVVKAISLLGSGFGLVLSVFGTAVKAITLLTTAFRTLAIVMMANPISLIIAAIVALGVAAYMLIKHWDKVKAFFKGLWGSIKSIFKENIDAVLQYIQPLLDAVQKVVGGVMSVGRAVGRTVGNAYNSIAGSDDANAGLGAVSSPVPVGSRNTTKVDAGGEIRIKIDQNNHARVVESRSNDSRMNFKAADTGMLMGGI